MSAAARRLAELQRQHGECESSGACFHRETVECSLLYVASRLIGAGV